MISPLPPSTPRPRGPPRPPALSAERASRAEATFNSALERPAAERATFANEKCGDDAELLAHVRKLLAAHDAAEGFMQDTVPLSSEIELARLKPEEAGEHIGPYKLLQQIGEGAFGVVWMAEQEQPLRRRVALKIIKIGMDTKEVIARFEQERQALAMMDHPNIAKVLEAGTTPTGRPYFVMELVRGIKITDYCDQATLSTEDRLRIFTDVCHAVQHAHQKGVIHRDIKPSNILVTLHDGVPVPKVIDFGVAKAMERRLTELTLFTQFEQMIGTPLYMSPEQAEMSGLDIDTRTDIYSLGVLLYELLTGRTPFDPAELMRGGRDEMRRTIREQEPPRPSTALSTMAAEAKLSVAKQRQSDSVKLIGLLCGDLDWIVMKAIEKDRTRRYASANGLAMDIQRHLNNEPVLATPPSFRYRLHRFVRRNRLAVGAATAVSAAILAGLAVSLWQVVRAERESRRANATLDALRATAPAFAAQADALIAQERFDEALEKLSYAAQLQPGTAAHWLKIGGLFECQLRFPAAAAAYRTAAECGGDEQRARRHEELCDRLENARRAAGGQLSREHLAELYAVMTREQRTPAELMPVARLLQREGSIALDYWHQRLRSLPLAPDRPLASRLSARPDGLLKLDLSGTEIADLQPLAGMPLAELDLSRCRAVRRLDPLQGLPLLALNLEYTEVADLAPLHGMHLESLSLANTRVTDIRVLAGMPLKFLDCSNLAAADYTVIAGAPLETLILDGARVRDADFLAGLPLLRKLSLAGTGEVRHLQGLASLPALETLVLPHNFYEFSADDLATIQALAARPSLQQLCAARAGEVRLSGAGTRESFAQEWQADLRWLHRLRQTGAGAIVLRLPDRTWDVDLRDQKIRDLSCLEGAPLSKLVLFNVAVSDLRPLSKMPLRVLDLRRTEVSDLSTLRGMPLHELYLWRVKARDFSVLAALPDLELLDVSETEFDNLGIIASRKLRELRIGGSRVTDLASLAGWPIERLHADAIGVTTIEPLLQCPKLTWLIPPRKARDLLRLKHLPQLQRISFQWHEGSEPKETAAQFWERYKP